MAEIVPFTLTTKQASDMIRKLAADTDNIVIIGHAQQRQKQRKVTRRQVELCVQRGTITEGPFLNQHGNWQVNLFRHAAGEEVTCTVAIEWASRLIVVTVF
ncbi:DUF4258 domain-containing protein [Sinorhizobium sp. GL28]|uniref:DUF4258 domain-containing protein n=1 Tax=Sinorhizobium sp. GL28 TaxID=1358418 RepID=UPI00071DA066|nr:DUF4258 domain-containing protein [Sinorhizobium sp. GL28]KSV93973.1 hypothetical protein N184_19955 [Sinorhizobium sp. GL28]